MKLLDPRAAVHAAVAASGDRPATAILHDSDDARLVVFRLAPGQEVRPHQSRSSVLLTVLEGSGLVTGERDGAPQEEWCGAGAVVSFAPGEVHGMRAAGSPFHLLAVITPRPGSR